MNASTPVIRLSLFALTGAMILGAATLHNRVPAATAAATTLTAITLPTISVRPSAEEIAAANAAVEQSLPTLPTVYVRPSEEEVIAARIDPTDRIQILSTITVYPDAEAIAAAAQPAMIGNIAPDADEDSNGMLDAVLIEAAEHHRLRLDMPYYSLGKVLARTHKN
ncbi:MAG TPA: hypothetical protein VIE67_09660 [Rudaea sp.]|jgi:prophage DNA circulation protein|uniref:hypothetical protein n=1 Tax=Rudaea sp. TaxID=2136325 RepID=UPI002F91D08E